MVRRAKRAWRRKGEERTRDAGGASEFIGNGGWAIALSYVEQENRHASWQETVLFVVVRMRISSSRHAIKGVSLAALCLPYGMSVGGPQRSSGQSAVICRGWELSHGERETVLGLPLSR